MRSSGGPPTSRTASFSCWPADTTPRRDGIVLGHTMQRGDWSLEVDPEEQARVIESHMSIFGSAPSPVPPDVADRSGPPDTVPPVEHFFDRVS